MLLGSLGFLFSADGSNENMRFVNGMSTKSTVLLLALGGIVIAFGIWGVRNYVNTRVLREHWMRSSLEDEMTKIQHPSSVTRVQHDRLFKFNQGSISSYFQSNSPQTYEQIRATYDSQLVSLGWTLKEESKKDTWGEDYGEYTRYYCKGPLSLDVYFTGQRASELKYTYAVEVSWGLVNCP